MPRGDFRSQIGVRASYRQLFKGERFTYNPRNQLTNASYNADEVWLGPPQFADLTYEILESNPLNRNILWENGQPTYYSSSDLNQYTNVGGQALEYDNNFNLKTYAGASFTFDAENHLVSAGKDGNTVQFVYDGLGRCVLRRVNGVTTAIAHDGWKPVVERDLSGNLKAVNIYGLGRTRSCGGVWRGWAISVIITILGGT